MTLVGECERLGGKSAVDSTTKDQLVRRAVRALFDHGAPELARELAENLHDFEALMEMCEGEDERLFSYIRRFKAENFAQRFFAWLCKRGEFSRLLSLPSELDGELTEFLSKSKSKPELLSLHRIKLAQFPEAAESLLELADSEQLSLSRQQTLFSLAKLAAQAATDTHFGEQAQGGLELVSLNRCLRALTLMCQPRSLEELVELGTELEPVEGDRLKRFCYAADAWTMMPESSRKEELYRHLWGQAIRADKYAEPLLLFFCTDTPPSAGLNSKSRPTILSVLCF
eukprot:TRINITY_DN1200_c0_g1_i7.p1 TRINITY_DN1200_c0_g1~~TRINITY_DN1200_c0_g1_i7.p1  ORF type:complete len:334 (-),score=45.98 TRINITY_DN1200_c0_g1_i7:120-974(-)